MFFQRFYDTALAQASYLLGCQRTGEAIVIDPNRDVQQYVDAAARERLRITHVTETHIHADFVSGVRELCARTGATPLLSDAGGASWKYAFAAEDGARLLVDGDTIAIGDVRLDVLHTPGHTPEHVSFVVTDTPAGAGAWGILTGDFVFVGDVGRPDLLEKAAGQAGTMESSARTLWRSLERFRALPDHLQLWPGHGAGSACGKALGAMPSSTVGYERLGNWAVACASESEFVARVLEGQPPPPPYFAEMKRVNKAGPRVLGGFATPPRIAGANVESLVRQRATIVDVRPTATFSAGHLPGALHLPLGSSLTKWAGWLVPYDRDLYVMADDARDGDAASAATAVRALAMIGLDRVAGVLGDDALAAWRASGHEFTAARHASPVEVAAMAARGEVTVVDIRNADEWAAGHLAGVANIPLGELALRARELPTTRPIVLHCQGGTRSAIAASVLEAQGIENVIDMEGGYGAWRSAGLPVTQDA